MCPTCPLVPEVTCSASSKAHLLTSAPFSGPAHAGIRPVIHRQLPGGQPVAGGFLSPFGHRHWLVGHPVPAGNSAFLTVGLPGITWTHTGFPRSTRTRIDRGGCPLYPGTVVLSRLDALPQPAPAAFSDGQSCTPLEHPPDGDRDNGTSSRVHVLHPSGLPLACSPRMGRGPLGFTLGFRPRGYPRRPPGQGRASSTSSELHRRHQPTSSPMSPLMRATSCRTARCASLRDRRTAALDPLPSCH
jgi:hypothetical protein